MIQSKYDYPGAKWWKFDFHTHTPESKDFMQSYTKEQKGKVTPEHWLQNFIDKGIDCVAITDHNSGAWIDKLKEANKGLKSPLKIFPGVEISVNGGVHILAIFDPQKETRDIDSLLGAVEYDGTRGDSDGITQKSVTEVINIISKSGGIPIPAHTDKKKGLFNQLKGQDLKQILENTKIYAIELHDTNFQKPQLYIDKKLQWSEVLGSDVHNFPDEESQDKKFPSFTWIKMDKPDIDGLRLALIDGKESVNRDMNAKPNQHAEYIIESIEIRKAKYMGMDKKNPLVCKFSPFLNTIIGARGSSKSTLLEFIRLTLRRDNDTSYQVIKDKKYFESSGDNLLTNESELSLIYKKGDSSYRLNWSHDGSLESLEVKNNGEWQVESGEIQSLFPVQIYSQKQIFELSKNPEALLDIIDKDEQVKFTYFEKTEKELTHQYKQITQKIREIQETIDQEERLTGELNDLNRKIKQIEKSGHKTVLQNYRVRQRQLTIIERTESEWQEMTHLLKDMADKIAPSDFDESIFTQQDQMLQELQQSNNTWKDINEKIRKITEESEKITTNWEQKKQQAEWMKTLKTEMMNYEQIKNQLEQQGIDPEKYPLLLKQQAEKQKDLKQIKDYKNTLDDLKTQREQTFKDLHANRQKLTYNRHKFLVQILQNNQDVRIEIKPFEEDLESVKKSIRKILRCDDKYYRDIDYLMEIYKKDKNFEKLKNIVNKIYQGEEKPQDNRFYAHLIKNLAQESFIDLDLWFPKDKVKITFGKNDTAMETGSAGQRCAALLAFILSYGDEPLLLDQPEDDLDNELIYELIVKKIRETKNTRQIIIVTHNANIVVNGDAEMVLPMSVSHGQSSISKQASIQDQAIRKKICNVLEGGQYAFSQRYKRIHLEN